METELINLYVNNECLDNFATKYNLTKRSILYKIIKLKLIDKIGINNLDEFYLDNKNIINGANMGKKWTEQDNNTLIELFNKNTNIIEIMNILQRSSLSIICKLINLNKINLNISNNFDKKKTNESDSDNENYIDNDLIKSFNKFKNKITKLQKELENYIKIKNEYELKIKMLIKQHEELKQTNTNYDNSNIILIKNKEYILIDDIVYKINKVKGNIYGTYNKTTNKVIKNKN
jgi:hypothetical protein